MELNVGGQALKMPKVGQALKMPNVGLSEHLFFKEMVLRPFYQDPCP